MTSGMAQSVTYPWTNLVVSECRRRGSSRGDLWATVDTSLGQCLLGESTASTTASFYLSSGRQATGLSTSKASTLSTAFRPLVGQGTFRVLLRGLHPYSRGTSSGEVSFPTKTTDVVPVHAPSTPCFSVDSGKSNRLPGSLSVLHPDLSQAVPIGCAFLGNVFPSCSWPTVVVQTARGGVVSKPMAESLMK